MIYANSKIPNGDRNAVAIVCAVLFCLFTFVYLYFYQADILAVAQHILSGGVTTYNGLIGAIIITAILFALQIGVSSVLKFGLKWFALSYFPSVLFLAILSSMTPSADGNGMEVGLGIWKPLVLFFIWAGGAILLQNISLQYYKARTHYLIFSDTIWRNVLLMGLMFVFVGFAGNNDPVIHYRMRMEGMFRSGDIEGATVVGRKSQDADSCLTMLRAYALARCGRLGDELFKYPISGSGNSIVPMATGAKCLFYPNDSIYKFLGAKPQQSMRVGAYLAALQKQGYAMSAVKDYILCGYLIDRRIDDFVRELPKYYEINDKLPLHYREALTLYTHLRSNPLLVYHNVVMDTDYEDLQNLEKSIAESSARELAVYDIYAGTYWWYYKYGRK